MQISDRSPALLRRDTEDRGLPSCHDGPHLRAPRQGEASHDGQGVGGSQATRGTTRERRGHRSKDRQQSAQGRQESRPKVARPIPITPITLVLTTTNGRTLSCRSPRRLVEPSLLTAWPPFGWRRRSTAVRHTAPSRERFGRPAPTIGRACRSISISSAPTTRPGRGRDPGTTPARAASTCIFHRAAKENAFLL